MATSNPLRYKSSLDNQQPNIVPIDGDREITYAEYGCPDGVPIIFFHGTPGSHQLGALLGPVARENGVRVLAPDRPGCGRSSPWPNRSVRDAAEFVLPVLDDADVQTAGLIAFSGGSPYALSVAATQTDRVDRIDIISGATPPQISEETPTIQRLLSGLATTTPSVLERLFRGQAWLAKRMGPSFVVGQYTANDNTVPEAVAETVKTDFVEAFARHHTGAVTEFRNTATDWGIDFDNITAEAKLWHGENDTNVPISGVRRLERVIPTAERYVFEDADHLQTLFRSVPDVLEGYR